MIELNDKRLTPDQLHQLSHLICDRIHTIVANEENVEEEDKVTFAHGHRQAKLMAQHAVCNVLEELSRESR